MGDDSEQIFETTETLFDHSKPYQCMIKSIGIFEEVIS